MSNIKDIMTPWQRLMGLLKLEKKAIKQVLYYAIFSGLVALTLPLGIQAIINLIQGAQVSTSWIVLVILVTLGVSFVGILQLMQMRIIETIQQRIFTRASFEFTYRFPKIKMQELRNYYPPELANRFFDTLTIQKGLSKILVDVPAVAVPENLVVHVLLFVDDSTVISFVISLALYVKATLAPCFAKTSTIPFPIPRLPPVIIAVLPSNSFIYQTLKSNQFSH